MQKVAIVYDRVNKWGGAERVLIALHEIFPKAVLFTSVYDSKKAPWARKFPKVITSFIQKIPLAKSNHEFFSFLMPTAFRKFDFSKYDVVISVTSEFAKGIRTSGKTKHICYCLTPTRYLWSGYEEYFKNSFLKFASKPLVFCLRIWDKKIAGSPDKIIAISKEVQKRIKKYYGRDSEIIFPPVNVKKSHIANHKSQAGKYYLLVSRLDYGYKKVDLAIKAFNKLGIPLVIVGSGREEEKLKRLAGKNITFTGKIEDRQLLRYYKKAKALIMPQEEDFGIVSVEAQSLGIPVIAYKKGGATDTVINGKTGILFGKQSVGSLMAGIKRFEKKKFKPNNLLNNAQRFSKSNFKKGMLAIIRK